ncbi:MAG TPA: zinc ribbon domain-containing protein [Solirubrobacteraceae bacterium]|nr:zinc ribbon domain-containing protein [Solirubrobacteraceae bacterium]
MSISGDTNDTGARAVPPASVSASPSQAPVGEGMSELRRRRDALAQEVTELHWDLGGLAYEMAIRDHFRLDVLVRRAAVLQERDAELAELERLLRLEESASAGSCPQCGAPHSRGALFCWQCGATLMERAPSTAIGGDAGGDSTTIMDALLAPPAPATSQALPAGPAPAPAQAITSQAGPSGNGRPEDGHLQDGHLDAAHAEAVRSQTIASEAVTSSEE